MQILAVPTINAAGLYDDISSRRDEPRRGRLTSARANVLSGYATYDTASPDVTALVHADMPPATSDDLNGNYTYLRSRTKVVYDALLTHAPHGRCPYCTQGQVSTLDHYLPRQKFPEFS